LKGAVLSKADLAHNVHICACLAGSAWAMCLLRCASGIYDLYQPLSHSSTWCDIRGSLDSSSYHHTIAQRLFTRWQNTAPPTAWWSSCGDSKSLTPEYRQRLRVRRRRQSRLRLWGQVDIQEARSWAAEKPDGNCHGAYWSSCTAGTAESHLGL